MINRQESSTITKNNEEPGNKEEVKIFDLSRSQSLSYPPILWPSSIENELWYSPDPKQSVVETNQNNTSVGEQIQDAITIGKKTIGMAVTSGTAARMPYLPQLFLAENFLENIIYAPKNKGHIENTICGAAGALAQAGVFTWGFPKLIAGASAGIVLAPETYGLSLLAVPAAMYGSQLLGQFGYAVGKSTQNACHATIDLLRSDLVSSTFTDVKARMTKPFQSNVYSSGTNTEDKKKEIPIFDVSRPPFLPSPVTLEPSYANQSNHDFYYEELDQSKCVNMGVPIFGGICAGLVTKLILDDDNVLFLSKKTCLEGLVYQLEHERISFWRPSPDMRTRGILVRSGFNVETRRFYDYKNYNTRRILNSYQEQVEHDGEKYSFYIGKTKFFAPIGHATLFSVLKNKQGDLVCTAMDPNRAFIQGIGSSGCEKVKDLLSVYIKLQTGIFDHTTLLIANKPTPKADDIEDIKSDDTQDLLLLDEGKSIGNVADNSDDVIENSRTEINFDDLNRELIEAAKGGDVDKAVALLELGADANAIDKDYFNYTPLHWAAAYGHKSVVELLLESDANLNAQALCGHGSPLNVSRSNPNNQPMRDFLVNHQNKLNRDLLDAAKIGDVAKVVILVRKGANPNATDGCYFHYTPLMWASGHNFPPIVAFLLNHGANPNARSASGYSALDIAYTNPNTAHVRALLSGAGGKAIQTEYEQEMARQAQLQAQQKEAAKNRQRQLQLEGICQSMAQSASDFSSRISQQNADFNRRANVNNQIAAQSLAKVNQTPQWQVEKEQRDRDTAKRQAQSRQFIQFWRTADRLSNQPTAGISTPSPTGLFERTSTTPVINSSSPSKTGSAGPGPALFKPRPRPEVTTTKLAPLPISSSGTSNSPHSCPAGTIPLRDGGCLLGTIG